MNKNNTRKLPILLLLAGMVLILFACQAEENSGEENAAAVEPVVEAPTEVTEVEAAAPTEAPEIDNCIDCHTDQARLMDTADPVEEVESENEGAG